MVCGSKCPIQKGEKRNFEKREEQRRERWREGRKASEKMKIGQRSDVRQYALNRFKALKRTGEEQKYRNMAEKRKNKLVQNAEKTGKNGP